MPSKRVQFDDETWQAVEAVARQTGKSFRDLASTAFADLLKRHGQASRRRLKPVHFAKKSQRVNAHPTDPYSQTSAAQVAWPYPCLVLAKQKISLHVE
jgi:hypothetical protein